MENLNLKIGYCTCIKISLVVLILFFASNINAQTYEWVKGCTGPYLYLNQVLCSDVNGDVITAETYQQSRSFGGFSVITQRYTDFLAIKYLKSGEIKWFVNSIGLGYNSISDICTDSLGNVYLCGRFSETMYVNGLSLIAANGKLEAFLIKVTKQGNVQWGRVIKCEEEIHKIAVNKAGEIYIAGNFAQSVTIGGTVFNSNSYNLGIYLAKFSSDGTQQWAKAFYTANKNYFFKALDCDNYDNLYLAGEVTESWLHGAGYIYLLKTDSNGQVIWEKTDTRFKEKVVDMDVNSNNRFNLVVNFENNQDQIKTIVYSYDFNGNQKYRVAFDNVYPLGIAVDNKGNSFLTSFIGKSITIGTYSFLCTDSYNDGIITKISPAGKVIWAEQISGRYDVRPYAICLDKTGNVLFNGYSVLNAIFGELSFTGCTYVVKMADNAIFTSVTPQMGQYEINFGETNINIAANFTSVDVVNVTYFPGLVPPNSVLPAGIIKNAQYYWKVNSTNSVFSEGIISAPINNLIGVTDPTKITWLKRNNSGGSWQNIGGAVVDGKLVSTEYFTTLGEFTIGTTDSANTLSEVNEELPGSFYLSQNYPNPFNPETTIKFDLPELSNVNCCIYNILGQKVATLFENEYKIGSISVNWNAQGLSSGIYLIVLDVKSVNSAKSLKFVKKAVLIK